MEGFCRGCLIKYDEPMELLQYTEKNRRLFVYSTGLQVKRNDSFTFQLCKDCFLNMKQACKFKKNCRTSDKRFRSYLALKDIGDPVDFCTFLKNSDDTLTFRLPMASGSSTPATQKCRDDDNESTCTSIRNFMTDILQGEEMPDTEARIIKEVIEEEADLLDDSLDSHWLQDDMSIDTDFRLDFSFSPFSTPRTVNSDHCYTPRQKEDQVTFNTINTEKQTKILKDFTNAFKSDENIEELSIFVGAVEKTESFKNLKELSPFGIAEIDDMRKPGTDRLKNKPNFNEFVSDLEMNEIDGMDISDSKTDNSNENLTDLRAFGIQEVDSNHQKESNNIERNQNVKELSNFGLDEIDSIVNVKSNVLKSNKSLKELISNIDIEEIEVDESTPVRSNKSLKEFINNMDTHNVDVTCNIDTSIDTFGKSNLESNKNLKELCDFSLDSFSGVEKAESKTYKTVQSLKELCDFSLDSIGSIEKPASINSKNNQSLKELLDISLNSFDDSAKSGSNTFKNTQTEKELDLSLNDFDDVANSRSNTFKTGRNIQEICDFGVDEMNEVEKSESNLELPPLSADFEKDKMDTPDYDLPKGVRSIQSQNDVSNSSINIEALLNDKSCPIDKKLEDALKDTDSQEFSLEGLLNSPTVFRATSAASTPTITNILFGEKLDTPKTHTKVEQCIDSYQDVEIFEEFFQNDTKEFDLEDIKRVNVGFKSEEWKKPIAVNDAEIDNEDNKSKNIDMHVSIDIKDQTADNYDTAVTESQNEIKEISDTTLNDKFDIERSYCKLCDIQYSTGRALSVHFSKTHNIKIIKQKIKKNQSYKNKDIATIDTSNDKFDIEKSYCKMCEKEFKNNRALSIHFSITHNIKIVKPEYVRKNNKINHLCHNCGKKCEDSTNFHRHVKICKLKGMREPLKCEYCLQEFTTQFILEKHLSSHTKIKREKTTKKEVVCTICGAILRRANNLVLHMRIHNKDYSVKCEYCDKGFYRQSDLNIHVRKHTGETPFSCTFCPRLFARRDVLLRHIRIHLNERLFECHYCGLKCIKKYDLIVHIRNKSCRAELKKKVKKKKKSVKKNKMDICIPEDKENIEVKNDEEEIQKDEVGVRKEEVEVSKDQVEVVKEVTVIYATGSNATLKQQLPFLETERSN